MKRLITSLYLTISLALGSFGMVWSGDFQKGMEAYKKGDCATAINEWTPLAKNNPSKAQHDRLLLTFKNGSEVPQIEI